jgi:uncharacterized protein (DUF433 family)
MNDRIDINPRVHHGRPIIRGTRVPVSVVLAAIAGGDPLEQVASDYDVTIEDVRACVDFAREEIDASIYQPAGPTR